MKLKLAILAALLVQTTSVEVFRLLSQPASVTVEVGKPFNLTCVATAGDNKFQWYKEDAIPNGMMKTVYSGAGNAQSALLSIPAAEMSHAGFYQCRVTSGVNVIYSDVATVSLHYFSTIKAEEKTVAVDTNAAAVRTTLPCEVPNGISAPGVIVRWYKDNVLVEKANAFVVHANTLLKVESLPSLSVSANSLVLFNIKKDMAGKYRCEAEVNSEHISVKKQTVITYTLSVNKEFGDINYSSPTLLANGGSVIAGESVTLCCGTVGYLDGKVPTYTWFTTHGGTAAAVTTGLTDLGRTLVVKVTDSHSYSCRACLGDSCQSSVVTASVTPAPAKVEFTTAPAEYYLHEDGKTEGAVSLTCTTSLGKGNWLKNGAPVSFPIDKPTAADSGVYQCYVKTSDSLVMKSTHLLVTQKLTVSVTAPSELDTATKGILSCTVGGYPVPDATIIKTDLNNDNTTITECTGNKTTSCVKQSGTSYHVEIDNTDLESSGTYACKVHHKYRLADGSAVEKSDTKYTHIAIVSPVDVYSLTTKTGNLQYGAEATFTCIVKGGRAPYKVEMTVGETVIYMFSNNQNEKHQGNGRCVGDYVKTCFGKIDSVNYNHEGVMTCTGYNMASNSTTMKDSMSLNTTVSRSTFVQVSGDFFPLKNADLILTCTHYEKPLTFDSTNITWFQDGKNIVPDSTVYSVKNGAGVYEGRVTAAFEGVTEATEGKYTCTSEGVSSAAVNVYVGNSTTNDTTNGNGTTNSTGIPPTVPLMTVPQGTVGVPMDMRCEAEGYPPPTIMWTLYSDKIVGNTTTVVKEKQKTISTLNWIPKETASMKVYCNATNVNGTQAASADLTVVSAAAVKDTSDSETAAIIAASVIGGLILLMCIIFLIVAILKHRRTKKHDSSADNTVIEKGPSKLEQTCISSCIGCFPCCFTSESSETGSQEEGGKEEKWRFPFLPKFHFKSKKGDITTADEEDDIANYKDSRGLFGRKSEVQITRISPERGEMEDSPDPSRKSSGNLVYANQTQDNFAEEDSEPDTPERLKAPAVIRSISHDVPRESTSDSSTERKRRNSAEDIPLAMRISNFFQLRKGGVFVTFNEDKNQYERTLSSTGKTV